MRVFPIVLGAVLLHAQSWETASTLNGVDMTALTDQQKTAALKVLRTEGCPCGCQMRLAECRVKDPNCGDSRALSQMAVASIKNGKTTQQVAAAIASSDIAKARANENRILMDPVPLNIEGAPSKGPANARVTIVEFSDFQCPYCSTAVAKAYAVLAAYPKDVRLVFKQFPLDFHKQARPAAEASIAAHAQGKFWQMHDALFQNYNRLSPELIRSVAAQIGLDMIRFTDDLSSGKYRAQVDKDYQEATKAGVGATPTFFINGQRLNAPFELSVVKPLIDAELARK